MKKLAALFFVLFLVSLGAFHAPKVFAACGLEGALCNNKVPCCPDRDLECSLKGEFGETYCTKKGGATCAIEGQSCSSLPCCSPDVFSCTSGKICVAKSNESYFTCKWNVFQCIPTGGNCSSGFTADCGQYKNPDSCEGRIHACIPPSAKGGGSKGAVFCDTAKTKVQTAIGCIPTDPSGFISYLLGAGIGLAGGIAFLLILLGGFQILTSSGNPEKLNAGRELVSSAIAGLLLIIFSIFILRFIGVTVLGIPGFK